MELETFRIYHSTLIEHYQFIEFNLEGIYAALSGKKLFYGLQDVEKSSLPHIIKEIRRLELSNNLVIFTDEEYEKIKRVLQRRNFWCHNCYIDIVFDIKSGGPKKANDIKTMISDLNEAEGLREALFAKKKTLLDNNRSVLLSDVF